VQKNAANSDAAHAATLARANLSDDADRLTPEQRAAEQAAAEKARVDAMNPQERAVYDAQQEAAKQQAAAEAAAKAQAEAVANQQANHDKAMGTEENKAKNAAEVAAMGAQSRALGAAGAAGLSAGAGGSAGAEAGTNAYSTVFPETYNALTGQQTARDVANIQGNTARDVQNIQTDYAKQQSGSNMFGTLLQAGAQGLASMIGLKDGTDNWQGGTALVGEEGPEIVNLPPGAQVIPNEEAMGILLHGKKPITDGYGMLDHVASRVRGAIPKQTAGQPIESKVPVDIKDRLMKALAYIGRGK
jgi:hypothetical protein